MHTSENTIENITLKTLSKPDGTNGRLYPDTFEQKISFNTIRQLLKDRCLCSIGEEMVDKMQFSSNYDEVLQWISRTDEILRLISMNNDDLPVGDFFDVR